MPVNPLVVGNVSESISPRPLGMSAVKQKILSPALTSQFQVWFNPPNTVRTWLSARGINYNGNQEFFSLSCSEASLPGSTLTTFEINNDFSGVTQRHAYRRLYDDRADFTCYVDKNHQVIRFFESWIGYIVDEQYNTQVRGGITSPIYHYRVQYPKDYKTEVYIHKFERDYSGAFLKYKLLEAFPVSINSMPVSYDSSSLLKLTVSFAYTRYVVEAPVTPPENVNAAGLPNIPAAPTDIPGTTTVTDEYYNNFGQRSQDATNTANFFGAA